MSKTDYDKAMLPSWHSFEEYNLCVKGHVQQRLLRTDITGLQIAPQQIYH